MNKTCSTLFGGIVIVVLVVILLLCIKSSKSQFSAGASTARESSGTRRRPRGSGAGWAGCPHGEACCSGPAVCAKVYNEVLCNQLAGDGCRWLAPAA